MKNRSNWLLWSLCLATIHTGTLGFVVILERKHAVACCRNSLNLELRATTIKDPSSWSVADDWEKLSSEISLNSVPDTRGLFNQDLVRNAASEIREIEEGEGENNENSESEEDLWMDSVIESVLNAYNLPTDPQFMNVPLYDTDESTTTSTTKKKTIAYEDEMGTQIAMVVHCNEHPEEINIEQGRALRELTTQQKNDVSQLITMKQEEEGQQETLQPTQFLIDATSRMFWQHAKKEKETNDSDDDTYNDRDYYYMDRLCVAKWMQKSLASPTVIGQHDKRVLKTISKYGQYGTGVLREQDFINLYFQTIVGEQKGKPPDALLRNLMHRQTYTDAVWRDIRNHGILSPSEQARQEQYEQLVMQQQQAGATEKQESAVLMDECEIMEWKDEASAPNFNRKSSHLDVELAKDNETPVWLRDGEFVFIDEESCIGCKQCVSVAPSAFLMLENTGRARTFQQRKGVDIDMAVDACPVNCMYFVSFPELKKFELARDQGDGRDDHKHFGEKSKGHTPLFVSGIESDANHKSSWHHYLRNKCYTSKQCPKAGCYDCPYYSSPGQNPHLRRKMKEAEHIRAEYFKTAGIANLWRRTADL